MIIVNIIHICIVKNLLQKLTVKTQKVWNFSKPPKPLPQTVTPTQNWNFSLHFWMIQTNVFPLVEKKTPKIQQKSWEQFQQKLCFTKVRDIFTIGVDIYFILTSHTPPSCMDQCLLLGFFLLKTSFWFWSWQYFRGCTSWISSELNKVECLWRMLIAIYLASNVPLLYNRLQCRNNFLQNFKAFMAYWKTLLYSE